MFNCSLFPSIFPPFPSAWASVTGDKAFNATMSLKILELGNLSLVNSNDNLKLSITTAVDIRVPESLSSLESDAIVKALTSGRIWVSRGIFCHLAIRVFIDGKPLNDAMRLHLLESLGSYLRGLKVRSLSPHATCGCC